MRKDGDHLVAFAQQFGRLTKGSNAGATPELRPFQIDLLRDLGNSGARKAYIQMPRKNGKSFLGSLIALHGLCADGEAGAEVYSVAGSRQQANIVFEEAKKVIQYGPLRTALKAYRNEIRHIDSGSIYRALAAEAGLHEGLNPSLVVFDELHVLGSDRRLWDVMSLGSGTREAPLIMAITTPGVRYGSNGFDSVAWEFWDYGQRVMRGEIDDPDFFYRSYEARAKANTLDEKAWHEANPALGDFLNIEDMRSSQRTTPENDFRTKRMGQWVATQHAWMPEGAWANCDAVPVPEAGTPVILGFDGSKSRDATALVGATIEPNPQVFIVQVWERPLTANHTWQVPRAEVTAAVHESCKRWDVKHLVSDPSLWLSELQEWANDGVPVLDFPQSASRMVPATQRFYEAVVTGNMRHDGNLVLARHVGNAVRKPNGAIAKDNKDSKQKIDAAVASIMAYDQAATLGNVAPRQPVFIGWA